jgi:hypothetical protein
MLSGWLGEIHPRPDGQFIGFPLEIDPQDKNSDGDNEAADQPGKQSNGSSLRVDEEKGWNRQHGQHEPGVIKAITDHPVQSGLGVFSLHSFIDGVIGGLADRFFRSAQSSPSSFLFISLGSTFYLFSRFIARKETSHVLSAEIRLSVPAVLSAPFFGCNPVPVSVFLYIQEDLFIYLQVFQKS